jgi:hypothetical protein
MNDQTKNTIQAIANLATTLSAVLALAALGWAVYETNKRDASQQTENWKRPVVFSIIREKRSASFQEIKSAYIQTATQRGLPREDIQDYELERILLSLQESDVIGRTSLGNYIPITVTEELSAGLIKSQQASEKYMAARSRIISILESESGKYTLDSLRRKLQEEGLDVTFEIMNNLITDLKVARVVRSDKKQYLHIYPQ